MYLIKQYNTGLLYTSYFSNFYELEKVQCNCLNSHGYVSVLDYIQIPCLPTVAFDVLISVPVPQITTTLMYLTWLCCLCG